VKRSAAPRWLAAGAFALGALAAFARDPFPTPRRIEARELAASLRARAPGLVVLDLRPPEDYAAGHVATARRLEPARPSLASLPADALLVLYADTDAAAHATAAALRASGHPNVGVLTGGYAAWVEGVLAPALDPTLPAEDRARIGELSRYFGGQPRPGDRLPTDTTSAARPRLPGRGC